MMGNTCTAALSALPKSDERKILPVCLLSDRTSASNDWFAERLVKRHPDAVSRMISTGRTYRKLRMMRQDLAQSLYNDQETPS